MNNPLVSIIIPTFNRAPLIEETLNSIMQQTYENWECIIIDDGSDDGTEAIIHKYTEMDSRFQYHVRPSNRIKGANTCRNYGFELSKGEYINWFDSDDLMMPSKILDQLTSLIDSKYQFSVCQTLVFEDRIENIIGLRNKKIYSIDFFNDFITNDIKWLTQSPIFRRDFLSSLDSLFDESLHQSQERDFFVKILSSVDNYIYDDTPLVMFRKHGKSISHSKFTSEKCDSNFRVSYKILKNYNQKLSVKSKLTLKKSLKTNLKLSIILKDENLSWKFRQMLNEECVNLSLFEKIKIHFGFFSMKYFNKGDFFFK